jgi:hypothetical protein
MKRPLVINNHLILKQRPIMLGVGFVLLLAVLACNMGAAQSTATPAVVTMVVTQSNPVCGDGVCTAPEDATTCAADCASGAAATVAPEDSGPRVKTTQQLNVRFGPSPYCMVLGSYPKDSEVDVLAKNPGGQWWQVPFGTSVGWISAAYTSPVTDLNGVSELPGPYCAPPTETPVPPTETPIPPTLTLTPAPVCGNGVIESGEECDTTDTCGGISICSSSCTCKLPIIVTLKPPILLTPIIIGP